MEINNLYKKNTNNLDNKEIIKDKYKNIVLDNYIMNLIWEHYEDYNKSTEVYSHLMNKLDKDKELTNIKTNFNIKK